MEALRTLHLMVQLATEHPEVEVTQCSACEVAQQGASQATERWAAVVAGQLAAKLVE